MGSPSGPFRFDCVKTGPAPFFTRLNHIETLYIIVNSNQGDTVPWIFMNFSKKGEA